MRITLAVTDAYSTAALYRGIIRKTDTGDDTAILVDLTAISRYIERRLGRFFTIDAGDIARTFVIGSRGAEPWGGHIRLWIDDLSANPASIKIDKDDDGSFADETALVAADYELHPLNSLSGPEAAPYTSILLTRWGAQNSWPHAQRVEITGRWGWPAIPDAIKQATINLTAILRLESPRATSRIPDDIGGSIEASPQAQAIIHQLMNVYRRVDY